MASGGRENYNIVLLLLIREDHNKLLQEHCHMKSSLNVHPVADECLQKKCNRHIIAQALAMLFKVTVGGLLGHEIL